ncbi:MAG: hypothetical protein ACXW5U_06145 [Thermoanaerobaculia bacterium]
MKLGTIDYAIRPDGGGVYVSRSETPTPQPIVVVTNWRGAR